MNYFYGLCHGFGFAFGLNLLTGNTFVDGKDFIRKEAVERGHGVMIDKEFKWNDDCSIHSATEYTLPTNLPEKVAPTF